MLNPYLYVVIVLMVVLMVIGAYLGLMVSNEAAKAAALQNQLNALKTNYTMLESQYMQLQNQYTTLQTQYNQLQMQYNELKTNYTTLQSQYDYLRAIYENTIVVKPIAYMYGIPMVSAVGMFLNITNPSNEPMNVSLGVFAGPPFDTNIILMF